MSDNRYEIGANWSSKCGSRNIVITKELFTDGGERAFAIRDLATRKGTQIGIKGLNRRFRFTGYDPAYGEIEEK